MAKRSSLLAVHDPALAEIATEGSPNEEVAVVARLSEGERLPEGVRVVTRFGDVATLRVRRDQVARLAESTSVIAVERSRTLWLSDEVVREDVAAPPYVRRPPGVTAVGRGVAVAAIDWGIDFGHPAFRNADGSTRLLALWDQRGAAASGPGNRWGYGRIFSREDIDRALREPDPYRALDYDPADADVLDRESGEWQGSHGAHVLDIAAGNGRGEGMVGVAPGAALIFVHLARTVQVLGRSSLGDSASVLEALDFCFSIAGDKPCVVNMSVGAHGGSHSGDSAAEIGIDRAVWLKDGRAVVNSAGNYFESAAHAQGRLKQAGQDFISFAVPAGDPTESEIEVYYEDVDRFTVAVVDPSGAQLAAAALGQESALVAAGTVVGHLYHQVRESGDRHIDLFLKPHAPGGVWNLRLDGDAVQDGRYHAWIERDRGPRPRFVGGDIARNGTTGSLCNGRFSITVGAYDPHDEKLSIADFSSAGPTRDGRVKPEILAPGVRIQAARSAAESELAGARYVLKDGTSMAAPHVAGAIAVMFEAAGKPLDIADTRALLFASARCASATLGNQNVVDLHRRGYGYLDIAAAEQAARDWGRRKSEGIAEPANGEEEFAPSATDPMEDRFVDGDDFVPIAHAGQFFPGPVEPGDRLVRSCEGMRYSAQLLSGRIETAADLAARGVLAELAGSGGYVQVLEARQGASPPRPVGRRLTDSHGRVLRGQTLFRPVLRQGARKSLVQS